MVELLQQIPAVLQDLNDQEDQQCQRAQCENGARFLLSIIAEITVDQHWNVYGILEGAPFQDERALFTQLFSDSMFETDYVLYGRLGLSYKF